MTAKHEQSGLLATNGREGTKHAPAFFSGRRAVFRGRDVADESQERCVARSPGRAAQLVDAQSQSRAQHPGGSAGSVRAGRAPQPEERVGRQLLGPRRIDYRIALADSAERLASFGPVTVLPTTWLIDRRGRVAATHVGLVDRTALEADIRQLLAE